MFKGAFGGQRQIEETLLKTAPLLLMGLGLTAAFRARVWNIGGEGQYYIGALVGGTIALTFPGWPRPLLIAAMLIGGVVGGILWAMIAGLLKVRRGMSEIISTLMLNYIAILLVQYVARGPLQQPGGYLPESAQFVAGRAYAHYSRQPDSSGRAPGAALHPDCVRVAVVDAAGLPAAGRRLAGQRGALCGHQRGEDHPVRPAPSAARWPAWRASSR